MMEGTRNPDIQKLLARLRGENQQQDNAPNQQQTSIVRPDTSQASNSAFASIPGLGLLPPKKQSIPSSTVSTPATPQPVVKSVESPQVARERSATPIAPDASAITTWPAALKFVTKHIISNEKAIAKIKYLISEQHKHERQWWAGREAIVARHAGRAGNQAKVADLLKSLGGASVSVAPQDPQANQAELEAYDKKVYKSLKDMTADFDRQLRNLQIPFFAIKHDLVILEDEVQKEGGRKGRLDCGELRELQRRMIETLEDLFGEE